MTHTYNKEGFERERLLVHSSFHQRSEKSSHRAIFVLRIKYAGFKPEEPIQLESTASSVSVYTASSCAAFRGQLVSPIKIQKQLGLLVAPPNMLIKN